MNRLPIIGHRGLPLLYPENTLPSFKAALEAGADGIELDIRLTKDKEIVVLHDSTLDRTTTACGPVSAYTFEQLCFSVLARSTFLGLDDCFPDKSSPKLENQPFPVLYAPIPRLVDVFDLLLEKTIPTCIIDIKWDNPLEIMLHLRRILQLPRYQMLLPHLTLGIWSPLFVPLLPARSEFPGKFSFIGENVSLMSNMAPFVDILSLDKDLIASNLDLVRSFVENGISVTSWTVDKVDDIEFLADLGFLSGIISNFVPICTAVLGPKN